jgi:hypothetical protein
MLQEEPGGFDANLLLKPCIRRTLSFPEVPIFVAVIRWVKKPKICQRLD